jgi:membrane-associated protein
MRAKLALITLLVSFCLFAGNGFGQGANFTGKILDQYEEPIPDVTITLVKTGATLTTDTAGRFSFALGETDSVMVFKSGYEAQTFAVNPAVTEFILEKVFSWKDLLNPLFYIRNGGLWLMLFIVFAETGLMVGFFLPGDSLLFVAGIYSKSLIDTLFAGGTGSDLVDLLILVLLVSICGILGNIVGYWFGRKSGPFLYTRKDTMFFKKKHLIRAKEFYDKHGGQAIVFARFLPIVRTFAPIIAGIVAMDKKKFMFYNIVGCVAWVFTMLFAGHYLDKFFIRNFGFDLKQHLELIVLGIVLVTTLPVLYKLFFGKRPVVEPETPNQNKN